jgi:hypothetical protein
VVLFAQQTSSKTSERLLILSDMAQIWHSLCLLVVLCGCYQPVFAAPRSALRRGLRISAAEVPGCDDLFNWRTSTGFGCSDYAKYNFCETDGSSGSGWDDSFGKFSDYAIDGVDASQACCACGGGDTLGDDDAFDACAASLCDVETTKCVPKETSYACECKVGFTREGEGQKEYDATACIPQTDEMIGATPVASEDSGGDGHFVIQLPTKAPTAGPPTPSTPAPVAVVETSAPVGAPVAEGTAAAVTAIDQPTCASKTAEFSAGRITSETSLVLRVDYDFKASNYGTALIKAVATVLKLDDESVCLFEFDTQRRLTVQHQQYVQNQMVSQYEQQQMYMQTRAVVEAQHIPLYVSFKTNSAAREAFFSWQQTSAATFAAAFNNNLAEGTAGVSPSQIQISPFHLADVTAGVEADPAAAADDADIVDGVAVSGPLSGPEVIVEVDTDPCSEANNLCDRTTTRCVPIFSAAGRDGGFTKMEGEDNYGAVTATVPVQSEIGELQAAVTAAASTAAAAAYSAMAAADTAVKDAGAAQGRSGGSRRLSEGSGDAGGGGSLVHARCECLDGLIEYPKDATRCHQV